ncbi:hypothetical protein KP509_10G028300 [Ceratopteris richardii]|uniref:Pseudouridine synthase n=1 Tax=Ceratopteris richardii TaxID=49495 RepID=A0A8T2TZR3_CERRI|nr:hypothetical protein KP509_10G028300 [Ceratopteris richardii]
MSSVQWETSSLLDFYCTKYKHSAPREGWQQRILNGQIMVDGEVVEKLDRYVRAGNQLTYHRLPWTEPPAPWMLEILYEDDHLLAVNKPSGFQVLPGGLYQQRTVLTQLMWRYTSAADTQTQMQTRSCVPSPVHRLGRGTSGKPSRSKVVVLQRDLKNNCTLVQVEIFSGRPHQIRIHLAFLGYPLKGDPLYISGGKPDTSHMALLEDFQQGIINQDDGGYLKPINPVPGECGYHLHAHKLMFIHPITEKPLQIVARCPSTLCMPGEECN